MKNLSEILIKIIAFFNIAFITGIPLLVTIYSKKDYLKKNRFIKNNSKLAHEIKKMYDKLSKNNNFDKQKNSKLRNIIAKLNNYVIIFHGILYIITLILAFVLKFNILVYVWVAVYVLIGALLWIVSTICNIGIDIRYPIQESFYKIVFLPFLEKYFPNYIYSKQSNATRAIYKFIEFEAIPKDAVYYFSDQIDYNISKNKVTLHNLEISKTTMHARDIGDSTQNTVTYFHGLVGKLTLDKKIKEKMILSSSNLLNKESWTYLDQNKKYKLLKEDKENIMKLLTKDTVDKLNDLAKKYKFDFYIVNDNELYFRIKTYDSAINYSVDEVELTGRLIMIHDLYKEIEKILNHFLDIL